jgi:hypothetical protein
MNATDFEVLGELEDEFEDEALELEPFFPRGHLFNKWFLDGRPESAARSPLAPMRAFAVSRLTPNGRGECETPSIPAPFPAMPPALALADNSFVGGRPSLSSAMSALAANPATKNLCIAVVDMLAPPSGVDGVYQGLNDDDMIFVASLQKISAMFAAFELRSRVQQYVTSALASGMSTSAADWRKMQLDLRAAWQPQLNAAFPPAKFPQGFPNLNTIFSLSAAGTVEFSSSGANQETIDKGLSTGMKFLEWLNRMLRWSDDGAASKCILALSYPYINGVLKGAGLFEPASTGIFSGPPRGLWISGHYGNIARNWIPDRTIDSANAGQPKTAPSRAAGARTPWATPARPKTNYGATARKVAQLFALIAADRLVDAASSKEMRDLLSGAELNRMPGCSGANCNAGSYIEAALHNAGRGFDKVFGKIGIGDERFHHDAGIVQRAGAGDTPPRYVAVVLGCAPGNFGNLLSTFVAIDSAL